MKPRSAIPPPLAERILVRILRHDLAEEVLGDLEEKFYVVAEKKSLMRAKLNYWYQVANYMRPFAIRNLKKHNQTGMTIYLHYFKVTTRNLQKQKTYAFINIFGLAFGLGAFILMSLFVISEYAYDRHLANRERIYSVSQRQVGNVFMGSDIFGVTPAGLSRALNEDFPEVAFATAMAPRTNLISTHEGRFLENGIWADANFFSVFGSRFLMGNKEVVFKKNESIVLTKSLADRIFGDTDPLGKLVSFRQFDRIFNIEVTGIIDDVPENSTLQYSFILNLNLDDQYVQELAKTTWNNNSLYTFILLNEGTDPAVVSEKFPALLEKYQNGNNTDPALERNTYFLDPLANLYLRTDVNFDIGKKGSKVYIYFFAVISLVVLILAIVNYMNLAIARSITRAREVGVRKVLGARKNQLLAQFYSESVLITFIALLIGIGIAVLSLPYFNQVVDRNLSIATAATSWLVPGLIGLGITVGLLAGSYPAAVVSSLKPSSILNGVREKFSTSHLQKSLIIIQFVVSISLLTCSILAHNQIDFIRTKELGYNKEHVLVIKARELANQSPTFKNALINIPGVVDVSASSHLPTDISSSTIISSFSDEPDQTLPIYKWNADYDFMTTFDIKLKSGRGFSKEMQSDIESGYIINESAALAMGWTPDEAIGKRFDHHGTETVIGVLEDFHMFSMYLPIQPLMVSLGPSYYHYLSIRITPENVPQTISQIADLLEKYSEYPLNINFLDQEFDHLYKADLKLAVIIDFFTYISFVIAMLGLFGLAAFVANQRTYEISIRKILGASTANIMILLASQFLVLTCIAIVVSIPLSMAMTEKWLASFAYRVDIGWATFAVVGAIAILLTMLTVSFQSYRAAILNPIVNLRSE